MRDGVIFVVDFRVAESAQIFNGPGKQRSPCRVAVSVNDYGD